MTIDPEYKYTVMQELTVEEYLEYKFLQWYYGHMQVYVNRIPFERNDYDTFQEYILDYYEHPRWGSHSRLKAPQSYRKSAKAYSLHGKEYDED